VDWYRNALAAGQCTLLWHGNVYTLNKPEPVGAEKALLAFPPLLRLLLRARNTKDFVTVNPRNNPSPKRKESSMSELQILMTGLVMGESPRWHDDRLWLSDMGTREVIAVDLKGKSEVVARVPTGLTGIGFLPDGHLLIDTMFDGRILRLEPDGSLVTHADVTSLAHHPWSDMVVDGRGNSYVGNLGFNFPAGEEFAPGILVLVTPDGSAWQVADGLAFPNGIAVTPDNSTLIVAESYGTRLTAFDISTDGSLSNRRVWADLPGAHPDGICVDAEGSVWYGDVPAKRCVRVREGGEVLQTIDLDRGCFACTLGGVNRRTLFLMAAEWSNVTNMLGGETRTGQVLTVEAPAPGAGWP
jgi:sugar lactone lactonase YvrE